MEGASQLELGVGSLSSGQTQRKESTQSKAIGRKAEENWMLYPRMIKLLASVEIQMMRVVIEGLMMTFVSVTHGKSEPTENHMRNKQSKHRY